MNQSHDVMQQHYYEITELYDLAEELLNTVDSELVRQPLEQLAIVEPLVEVIGNAADVLTEEFIAIAENNGRSAPKNKSRIEGALRKIYSGIESYHMRVNAGLSEGMVGIRNIADTVVKKLKRQMEVIVAMLVDFVELSLDRIMQKSQVEELKLRQEKIALMLHQFGQSQGAS